MTFFLSIAALGVTVLTIPAAAAKPTVAATSIPNVVNISNSNVTASYSGFNFTLSTGSPYTIKPTNPPVTIGTDIVSLGTAGALVIDSSTTSLIENVNTSSVSSTVTRSTFSLSPESRNLTVSSSLSSRIAMSLTSSISSSTNSSTSPTSQSISSSQTASSSQSSSNSTGSSTQSSSIATLSKTSASFSAHSGSSSTSQPSSTSKTASSSQSSNNSTASSSSGRNSSSTVHPTQKSSKATLPTSSASSFTRSSFSSISGPSSTSQPTISSQSSSTSPPPLTTFSTYPPGFTAVQITTGETTDGHTTSTDSSGHHTIIPIVGGSLCWFCPHGGSSGGIELPGLPFPGVFPPPPGPPGFSISANAPSITIDSSGDPTYSSEPTSSPSSTAISKSQSSSSGSSSSSSSCTKSITASFCTTSLIYEANTASVTSTSTTTKCSTTTACSATDQTTTIKTTTTSTGSACSRVPVPSGFLSLPDDDDGTDDGSGDTDADSGADPSSKFKRSIIIDGHRASVPRNIENALEKRGRPKPWLGPEQCSWGSAVPPYVPQKINNIRGPSYPTAQQLANYVPGAKPGGNAYIWLVTKLGEGADTCARIPWDLTTVSNGDVLSTQDAQGLTYQWDTGEEDGGAYVNADHVFELKILKYFFTDDAPDYSSNQAGCDNWRKFWVYETNAETSAYQAEFGSTFFNGGNPWTRMQTLFKLLPGSANPTWSDFVGMDKNVNMVKGNLLQRGLGDVASDTDKPNAINWIETLNLMGVAQKAVHMDEIASRFSTTNARIYGAMQQIQGISGGCGPPEPNYASKYSSWMENYLQTQGQQVTDAYNSILTTKLPASVITTTLTDEHGASTGEDTHLADLLASVTKSFPVESMTYDTNALLTWPAAPAASQAITIKKRDDSSTAIPAACAPSASSATQTSTSGSSSSTSVTSKSSSSTPPPTSSSTTGTPTSSSPFTVTINPSGSPTVACDFSPNSCAHVACADPGTTASCTEDEGTGGGYCQCLAQVGSSSPPSTTPPPTTAPTSTTTSAVTGFTVTMSAGGTSPSIACDGSTGSCAHVACPLAGETASCVTNDQTGQKVCSCAEAIG